MKNWIFRSFAVSLLVLGVTACSKKTFDEYYARPDWLAQPIYQQLDSMGDFKNFLVCIEKPGIKMYWAPAAPGRFLRQQTQHFLNSLRNRVYRM